MGEAAEKIPPSKVGFGNPPVHTRFGQPGGNLPGRSGFGPVAQLMSKVREHYHDGDKLLPILDAALSNPKERMTAVQIILERGWGKAPQPIAMTGDGQIRLSADGLSETEFKALGDLLSKLLSANGNPPNDIH